MADGASTNWTIHRKHFSQMTGVLDLMHALSYAYRAAAVLDDSHAYRRYAEWIWQGNVQRVIHELKTHQRRLGLPEKDAGDADLRQRLHRALTDYTNHRRLMNYAEYRRDGLPLYRSRDPQASDLWCLLDENFDSFSRSTTSAFKPGMVCARQQAGFIPLFIIPCID